MANTLGLPPGVEDAILQMLAGGQTAAQIGSNIGFGSAAQQLSGTAPTPQPPIIDTQQAPTPLVPPTPIAPPTAPQPGGATAPGGFINDLGDPRIINQGITGAGFPGGATPTQTTGGAPNLTSTDGGTSFTPDFRFNIDPNNPDSSAAFINSLLSALGPGLASGQFSNFQTVPGAGGNVQLGQAGDLLSRIAGGGQFRSDLANVGRGFLTDPAQAQAGGEQDLASQLLQQIAGGGQFRSLAAEQGKQRLGAPTSLLGQPPSAQAGGGFQAQTPQPLGRPQAQAGGLQAQTPQPLGRPQAQVGGTQQGPAGPGQALQGAAQNVIQSNLGGALSPEFIEAQRRQVFEPGQERLLGRLNQLGGGQGFLGSGLPAEAQRRSEQDFQDQLTNLAFQGQQAAIPQATQLGGQQFGQGITDILSQLQQQQFGAGLQNQLIGQSLQTAGQLGQLGGQQFGQEASNINQLLQQALAGGGFQNQLIGQSLGTAGQLGQLGLGQQGLALEGQQQRNQFGLGQSAIGSDLIQTLLAGREGGGGLGTILALLTGSGGGGGLLNSLPGLIDIFRNPNEGEVTNPPTTHPPGTDTGGFTLPPDLIPGLIDIFFPGGLGGGGGIPGTGFEQFDASFSGLPTPPFTTNFGGNRPGRGPFDFGPGAF